MSRERTNQFKDQFFSPYCLPFALKVKDLSQSLSRLLDKVRASEQIESAERQWGGGQKQIKFSIEAINEVITINSEISEEVEEYLRKLEQKTDNQQNLNQMENHFIDFIRKFQCWESLPSPVLDSLQKLLPRKQIQLIEMPIDIKIDHNQRLNQSHIQITEPEEEVEQICQLSKEESKVEKFDESDQDLPDNKMEFSFSRKNSQQYEQQPQPEAEKSSSQLKQPPTPLFCKRFSDSQNLQKSLKNQPALSKKTSFLSLNEKNQKKYKGNIFIGKTNLHLCSGVFFYATKASMEILQNDIKGGVIFEVPLEMELEGSDGGLKKSNNNPPVINRDESDYDIASINSKISNIRFSPPNDNENQLNLQKGGQIRFSSSSAESIALGVLKRRSLKDHEDMMTRFPQLNYSAASTFNEQAKLNNSEFFQNPSADPHEKSVLTFKESYIPKKTKNKDKNTQFNNSFLQPFKTEYQIDLIDESSSQEDETIRQMEISGKNIMKKKKDLPLPNFPNHHSNNERKFIRESSVDLVDLYEIKEKKFSLEEEKITLLEKINHFEEEIEELKMQKLKQTNKVSEVQQIYQGKLSQIEYSISIYDQKLNQLENEISEKNLVNNELMKSIVFKEEELSLQTNLNKQKQQKINDLMSSMMKITNQCEQQIEGLKQRDQQKNKIIDQLHDEYDQMREELEEEIQKLRQILKQQNIQIEGLNNDNFHKKELIDKLQNEYHEIMENLEAICEERNQFHAKQSQHQRQMEEIRASFSEIITTRELNIRELEIEKEKNESFILQLKREIQKLQQQSDNLEKQIISLKKEGPKIAEEISDKFSLELDYLRREVITLNKEIQKKDEAIEEMSTNKEKLSRSTSKMTSLMVQFLDQDDNEQYIQELEHVIGRYEKIIQKDIVTIRELQEKVYEYLSDALDKENQLEDMYDDLCQYETDLNSMLIEKIAIENENKRMKKMMGASDRKISSIGSRLVHAAKQKMKEETLHRAQSHGIHSSSSTVKIQNY